MDPTLLLPAQFAYLPDLATAPYGVALFEGETHRVLWMNGFCQSLWGEPVSCGHSLREALRESGSRPFFAKLQHAYETGEPVFFQSPLLGGAPPPRSLPHSPALDISLVPWRSAQGAISGIYFIAIDRSAESETKWRAERSEEKLLALMESLPHAVYVSDEKGNILFANKRWQRYTGTTPESMNKQAWYQRVHPEDAKAIYVQWNKRTEQNRFEVCARILDHDSNQYRWQQIVGIPFVHELGGPANWIGTWTDLTKRVQAEEHQNELRLRFVSTVSHDLRGPLTAIRTNAESMLRHAKEPTIQTKLERIVRTVDRTNDMLEELLNINVLHHDGLPRSNFVSVELKAAMQLSLANFRAMYDGRLVVDMPDEVTGVWHAATLVRAIDNLLGNAFKYGDEHAPVTLRVAKQERYVEIQVHNEGPVLSLEQQQKIFVPYERLSDGVLSSGKPRGWGLGLSFVSDVARAHGGTITVASTETAGTTFSLCLPMHAALRTQGSVPTHPETTDLTSANAAVTRDEDAVVTKPTS